MGVDEPCDVSRCDFFVDDLPRADVIVMGNVLHDWDESRSKRSSPGFASLDEGGR